MSPKVGNFRGGGGGLSRSFFPGTQVTLGSCCSSAVAYRLLLAKKDLYRVKLKILDHVLT